MNKCCVNIPVMNVIVIDIITADAQIFDSLFNGKYNNNMPQIYINGNKLPTGTNYRDVKLHAHDEIALIYGTPSVNIPSKYDFPQGL